MMTKSVMATTVTMAIVIITIMAMIEFDMATAECCYSVFKCSEPKDHPAKRCADCEEANIYCGYGSCNIFGCNCDGGCRKGNPALWCWNTAFCENQNKTSDFIEEPASLTMSLDNSDSRAQTDLMYRMFIDNDQNDDKMLNSKEFEQLIQTTLTDDQISSMNIIAEFKKLDKDGNNLITMTEIDADLDF